jgi:hypothetical protein
LAPEGDEDAVRRQIYKETSRVLLDYLAGVAARS